MKVKRVILVRCKEKGKVGVMGVRNRNRGVNMIKGNYVSVWKCPDGMPYYV
jgi:hypothetical protein